MIYKMAANKKAYRCRQHPVIFKISIYFAVHLLRLDTSPNSSKHKAMTRVGEKSSFWTTEEFKNSNC